MRINPPTIPPTIFETFPRNIIRAVTATKTGSLSSSPGLLYQNQQQSRPLMASSGSKLAEYGVESTDIKSASGVSLNDQQQLIIGSVLDLFAGRPSKRKLTLWTDDATFVDPLTVAEGRKQYEAQWYGLKAAFSNIERLSSEVKSAGNPIEIALKNKYTVKMIGTEQEVDSQVLIHTTADGKSITKVEDKWDGKLPEGAFSKAMRDLNSVTVPMFVSVPRSVEEEEAKEGMFGKK